MNAVGPGGLLLHTRTHARDARGTVRGKTTVKSLEAIAHEKGVEIQMEKVEDMERIMSYGITSTPGVAIDGQVVHAGGVPSRPKAEAWFQGAGA